MTPSDPRAHVTITSEPTKKPDCPFCNIEDIAGNVDVRQIHGEVIYTFTPLNPVVEGHALVVPRLHVEDATMRPEVTAKVFEAAARYARYYPSANLITSIGAPATQTVRHLHVHVVPRREGDGLRLPWTST